MRRRSSPANSASNRTGSPASQAPATAAVKALSTSSGGVSREGRRRLATTAGGPPDGFPPGHASTAIGPSTACGPTSTSASTPSPASVSTARRNCTFSRAWRRQ